jgi:putative glutamine amidotransferase
MTLPFVRGVQWHPEYLPQKREQRRIFESLLRHAKRVDRAAQAAPGGTTVARKRKEPQRSTHGQAEVPSLQSPAADRVTHA